ncbi:hypothetical protein DSM3645_03103 [Blastopirellula marina DSM 3645]|uniref:Uncharacterized protein n=1 Tax=Blastopirellula marina DSM 3645 TaxID=314230 RepID=A3ZVT4_9BACT|nr:hypothetical protein DSM3645_03103 [Blastopirellula marina DSM 3645]
MWKRVAARSLRRCFFNKSWNENLFAGNSIFKPTA